MIDKNEMNHYAVIPASVRFDEDLSAKAKLLYGDIAALANAEGYCSTENRRFEELYEISGTTLSRLINSLCEKGYLVKQIVYAEGTQQVLERRLYINNCPNENIAKFKYNLDIITHCTCKIFNAINHELNATQNRLSPEQAAAI